MASLVEKRMNVGNGTGLGEPVPNILAKLRSLTRLKPIFMLWAGIRLVRSGDWRGGGAYPDVATNFSVPAVTVFRSVPLRNDDAVSIEFAVR